MTLPDLPYQSTARSGPALIRASQAYESECRITSWLLFGETVSALACALLVVFLVPAWPIKLLAGLIAGLIQVRLFIFYHDALHGAVFRKDPIAHVLMSLVGFYLIIARSVWKETHDYHHTNNAKVIGSWVGSFPIMTVVMDKRATKGDRFMYRFARHPMTILFGYFTVFIGGMAIKPFRRNAKQHWGGPVAIVCHYLLFAAVVYYFGWVIALTAILVPSFTGMAFGAYLFYAQHNFPDMKIPTRSDWTYTDAALSSSSMFDMSKMMHWFTGNIGFHHVHHLNHRIPFYRLPEAMSAIPELQTPYRTSWRLRDIMGCLRLAVWDPTQNRMLTYKEGKLQRSV